MFQPIFSGTNKDWVDAAIKAANDDCLPNAQVRSRWVRTIKGAMALMSGQDGELRDLAVGRMAEFKFLIVALERYEE